MLAGKLYGATTFEENRVDRDETVFRNTEDNGTRTE